MQVIKRLLGGLVFLSFALVLACASQKPAIQTVPASDPAASVGARYTGDGVSLDKALSDIAAYYAENLSANTKIALIDFESDARLLSDYIFEELWIRFEDSASFTLVDRRNLDLIRKELEYQRSGDVSEESAQSVGRQYGAQTLVYGKMTRLGEEYRLVVYAIDVERAVASIRSAQVRPDPRFTALVENSSGGAAGANMANALYSGVGNPWRFTAQTDRSDGEYHDGDYMTLHIYSERDAWFKITHIDVHGDAQVIYPVSPRDNNFIKAGETRRIPDNTRFRMITPYGEEMILVGAYEERFVIQKHTAAPLSNSLLVRGITVEREDTRTDIRPVATARFTYRIGP